MATPTTSDFLVVPINGTDLIAFYRGSNISRPLYLSYSNFLAILTQAISGGTKILLQTNGVDNPAQNVLNLIEGTGIDITDNGAGGITITATGGGGGTYTVNNGLSPDPLDANNFQLGGTLIQNTTITNNIYTLYIEGIIASGNGYVSSIINNADGNALYVQADDSTAYGLDAKSDSGRAINANGNDAGSYGVYASNKNGTGLRASSTNSYSIEAITTNGIPALFSISKATLTSSILEAIELKAFNISVGGGISSSSTLNTILASRVITNWTTANDVSQYQIQTKPTGGALQTALTLKGTGQLQLNKYTAPFSGTAVYSLGVDASGNVITTTSSPVSGDSISPFLLMGG
jgi:hypothetical protein